MSGARKGERGVEQGAHVQEGRLNIARNATFDTSTLSCPRRRRGNTDVEEKIALVWDVVDGRGWSRMASFCHIPRCRASRLRKVHVGLAGRPSINHTNCAAQVDIRFTCYSLLVGPHRHSVYVQKQSSRLAAQQPFDHAPWGVCTVRTNNRAGA